jgi:GPH family glycoside/pentoside/hexuronide:cation symporter
VAKIDTSVRPFSGKDEVGYLFGDMAGSFVNLYVDAYFLTFCTYCLGIDATWMAGLFLFARLWDAINDPIIGSFPDRWHLGKSLDKFTPWIKLFMIPLALSGVLCFFKVPLEGIALHAFVAFAYIFFGMSYTGTSMPFGAMANVVTVDPVERSKLSRARSVGGGLVGAVALGMVPVICYKDNQPIPERFTMLAVIFGICCGGIPMGIYALVPLLAVERSKADYALAGTGFFMMISNFMLGPLGTLIADIGYHQLGMYVLAPVALFFAILVLVCKGDRD